MGFCTAINCMDGRTQLPVNDFMSKIHEVTNVDTITEPGPARILGDEEDPRLVDSILHRVRISVENHDSQGICVVGHHDCAGNPVDKATQLDQISRSVEMLREHFPGLKVIGLWVNEQWVVERV
jgi:carbonic anhydrase